MILTSEINVVVAIIFLVLIGIFTTKKPRETEKQKIEFEIYTEEKDS